MSLNPVPLPLLMQDAVQSLPRTQAERHVGEADIRLFSRKGDLRVI